MDNHYYHAARIIASWSKWKQEIYAQNFKRDNVYVETPTGEKKFVYIKAKLEGRG